MKFLGIGDLGRWFRFGLQGLSVNRRVLNRPRPHIRQSFLRTAGSEGGSRNLDPTGSVDEDSSR